MDQYAKSFTKPSIRIGTITVLLAMLGSFFPNIYLYLAHGVWPDASHMFSAWGSVAMAFGAFYLVEPISYFPVFGPTGTYIGILSGNISQIRLPAASTAQDVLGVEPSSHKGEVVGILAICGSVVTNILFLTVAVVAGSTLLAGGAAMGYAFGAAVITSLSFLLLNIGIAGAGAAQASFATLIEPVASVICGVIVLNEKVTLFTIIGIVLILLSVWVNSMHTHEKAPAREKAPAK